MNYYYGNYPMNNQYMYQPQMTQMPPQAPQGINGKFVDSPDMVKAAEVPLGSYGIFPKADLSEIYIKTWNNNGTTSIVTFKPSAPEPQQNENVLLTKIESLESKLDNLIEQNKKEGVKNVF